MTTPPPDPSPAPPSAAVLSAAPPSAAAQPAPTWTVGSAVATTLSVVRGHAAPLLGAVLLVQLPYLALAAAVGSDNRALNFLNGLVGAVQIGLVVVGATTALRGERPRLGAMFSVVGARFGPLFGQGLLGGLAVLLGLVLLIVPGVIAWSGFFVSAPAALAEPGLGANGALQRSWELTRGRRWLVLGVAMVFLAIFLAVALIVGLAGAELLPPESTVAELLGELLPLPFLVAYGASQAVVYHLLVADRDGQDPRRLVAVFE